MKKTKRTFDLERKDIYELVETILDSRHELENDDNKDTKLLNRLKKKYDKEPNKLMLGTIYFCMQSEEFYDELAKEFFSNAEEMVDRIYG